MSRQLHIMSFRFCHLIFPYQLASGNPPSPFKGKGRVATLCAFAPLRLNIPTPEAVGSKLHTKPLIINTHVRNKNKTGNRKLR
jgi:hypothetical protein